MNDLLVITVLSVLSFATIAGPWAWGKVKTALAKVPGTAPSGDDFENRMRLVRELLDAVEDCDTATEAVKHAGDVIARHWRDHEEDLYE
jgi:hypothetical protein